MSGRLALLACLAFPAAAAAQGTSGALLMSEPLGARPLALGSSYVGVSDDAYALVFNPAGLGLVRRVQAAPYFGMGLADTRIQSVTLAYPLKRWGGLGLGLVQQDAGKIRVFHLDGTQETRKAQQDLLVSLGYGYVSRPDPGDWGRFGLGVAAKYFRSTLVEQSHARALALDVGALWETPWGVQLGASLSNIGPGVGYTGGLGTGEKDPLPRTLRAGASKNISLRRGGGLLLALDATKTREGGARMSAGVEFLWRGYAALRAGYKANDDLGSLTAGAGLRAGWFHLDYGFGLMSAINNLHFFSLGFEFGRAVERPSYQDAKRGYLEKISEYPEQLYQKGRFFEAAEAAVQNPGLPRAAETLEMIERWVGETLRKGAALEREKFHYAAAYRSRFKGAQPAKLVADLEQALAYNAGNDELERQLARARRLAGEEAREAAERSRKLYERALGRFESGAYEAAIGLLRQALQADPGNTRALDLLDRTIQASMQRAAPRAAPARAAEREKRRPRDSRTAERLYREALVAYSAKDFKKAVRLLEEALRNDPGHQRAQNALSRIRQDLR